MSQQYQLLWVFVERNKVHTPHKYPNFVHCFTTFTLREKQCIHLVCFCIHSSALLVHINNNSDLIEAVSGRNRTLFRYIFQPCSKRCSTELSLKAGSYVLHRHVRYLCIYAACMTPALNERSVLQCFEHSNTVKIRNRITFNFYPGLPQLCIFVEGEYISVQPECPISKEQYQ